MLLYNLFFYTHYLLQPVSLDSTLLLITNLPDLIRGRYTESDMVNLLSAYGFKYEHDNIYVIPQAFMVRP